MINNKANLPFKNEFKRFFETFLNHNLASCTLLTQHNLISSVPLKLQS